MFFCAYQYSIFAACPKKHTELTDSLFYGSAWYPRELKLARELHFMFDSDRTSN